ncbi:MAG: pyridoxal phosphate-dependent aminotransferase [Janthinobacterium lividum]
MANQINRRNWIKSSALLAGGLTYFSNSVSGILAKPTSNSVINDAKRSFTISEEALMAEAPPTMALKARLLANENPFGPSAKAKEAIKAAMDTSYQYPFMYYGQLVDKIAAFEGVKKENVFLDAGSSPLLLASAMHFIKSGSIVTADPSYDDLTKSATELGGKVIHVPLTADYKLDLDAMEKAIDSTTSLVYICNPNNPTATVLDAAKLKAFCERVSKKVTVFIDEAYIDYLPNPQAVTLIDAVKKGQNVIIARTFSKLYGFAGLRIGYIVAQPEMLKTLSKYTQGSMSVSATTLMAAIASYQDREFLDDALAKTLASKKFLYETLKKEGYDYIPSSTNFVMFQIKMDGQKFTQEMMKRGVGVRFWKFNDKDWCRVSIGRMDEMQAFADAFKQLS